MGVFTRRSQIKSLVVQDESQWHGRKSPPAYSWAEAEFSPANERGLFPPHWNHDVLSRQPKVRPQGDQRPALQRGQEVPTLLTAQRSRLLQLPRLVVSHPK